MLVAYYAGSIALFFGAIMLNCSLKKLQISPKNTISAGSGLL